MVSSEPNLEKLRAVAVSGELKVPKFRSVIWNVLLGALGKWLGHGSMKSLDMDEKVMIVMNVELGIRN